MIFHHDVVVAGIGAGLCYAPSIVILGQYFDKRRALANGISFCGAGIGSFVLPPVIRYSLDTYGLDTTFLLLAACMLHVSVAGMLFRPPEFYVKRYMRRRAQRRSLRLPETVVWVSKISRDAKVMVRENSMITTPIDGTFALEKRVSLAHTKDAMYFTDSLRKVSGFRWKLLFNPVLLMYAITLSVCDSSYGNVYIFMPSHATMAGFSKSNGALLISVMGITQAVSRLVSGWFADLNIIDKKHIYQWAMFVCGMTLCVMPLLQSYVLLVIASVLCSFSAGGFVVLSAVLIAENLGTENLPTTYGVLYSTESFFFLGSPVFMGAYLLNYLDGTN